MSEMVERVMGVLDAQLDFLLETGHLRLGPAYKADGWLLREMAVAVVEEVGGNVPGAASWFRSITKQLLCGKVEFWRASGVTKRKDGRKAIRVPFCFGVGYGEDIEAAMPLIEQQMAGAGYPCEVSLAQGGGSLRCILK